MAGAVVAGKGYLVPPRFVMPPAVPGNGRLAAGQALPLALVGLVLAAAGIVAAGGGPGMGWPLRAAAAAYWAAVTWTLLRRGGAHPPLLSPLYLLGSLALWLYSLVPAAYITATFGAPLAIPADADPFVVFTHPHFPSPGVEPETAIRAIGSAGEAAALSFALVALAAVALVSWSLPPAGRPPRPANPWPAFVLGLAVSAGGIGLRLFPGLVAADGIRTLLVPVLTACLAILAIAAWRHGGAARTMAGLLAAAAAAALLPAASKPFFIAAALSLALVAARRRPDRSGIIGGILLATLTLGFLAFYTARHQHLDGPGLAARLGNMAISKTVFRQTETLYCLAFALRDTGRGGADPGFTLGPLYFVEGVVPRALWPAKPDLSRGHHYALRYCGYRPQDFPSPTTGQSASITLLGEPFVQAGPPGPLVFCAFVVVVLALLSRLWMRPGWPAAAVLATAPWLVDFDQHAALYVANAVKFGAIAAVTVLVLRLRTSTSPE
jgi:hypothetical protein